MAIGLLSMLTPLETRIDRWATSGKATKILLHPEDYLKLNETKREKLTAKYNLPVEVLGGARGIQIYLNRREKDDDDNIDPAVVAQQLAGIEEELKEES